jgi:NAD+ dependent glucose-6-phosphate dehydrogenase
MGNRDVDPEMGKVERFLLVTGAAGRIGRAFVAGTSTRYRFRLADREIGGLDAGAGHEIVALDVADLGGCQAACAGIDTVVHLAADPSPEADFAGSLLENNIRGAYNIFRAATDARCRRVIFASSLHVVAGYAIEDAAGTDAPVRPLTMYGVSKCFGEATARYFAEVEGLSCIAVRIGAYEAPWIREESMREVLSGFISARDLNQLLIRCIETSDIQFAIVHGISDNGIKRVSLVETESLLGYQPQDDGFRWVERK